MPQSKKHTKLISYVVPVYNEEAVVGEFITALNKTLIDLNYAYEIIIIDDGSIDRTSEIVHKSRSKIVLVFFINSPLK